MQKKTSASDNGAYPEFCYFASKRDDIFNNFKNNPIYNQILEHVSPELGKDYLEVILKNPNFNFDLDKWNVFFQNDKVGNPRVATYNLTNVSITCSPSTLRYIKVLSDIISLFDVSKINSVYEVGIGYAGQCRILMSMLQIAEYNLIDLPEVLSLAERFLNEVKLENRGGTVF